jgi:hypothetical protein
MTVKKLQKVKLNNAARRPTKTVRPKLLSLTAKKAKRKTQPQIAREGRRVPAALEVQLRKTVAELGLTEARKIFDSVEAAFSE